MFLHNIYCLIQAKLLLQQLQNTKHWLLFQKLKVNHYHLVKVLQGDHLQSLQLLLILDIFYQQ
ncbi:MAG: hypothetical protein CMG80_05225 [Marinobacter sp.]|nr:hypothetical protein [Marinobacter sp.]